MDSKKEFTNHFAGEGGANEGPTRSDTGELSPTANAGPDTSPETEHLAPTETPADVAHQNGSRSGSQDDRLGEDHSPRRGGSHYSTASEREGGRDRATTATSNTLQPPVEAMRTVSATDSSHPHRDKVLEKIKSTADDYAPGVVDKVRTAKRALHLDHVKVTGPSRFLNPTNIHMNVRYASDSEDDDSVKRAKQLSLLWRSRDNRKGRNSIAVPMLPPDEGPSFLPLTYTPKLRTNLKAIGMNFWRMFTTFPYWDMAFWSGWSYSIGSILFVVDGVLAWGPVAYGSDWEPENADTYGGPLCFFIGALFYQVGAVAAYLEAVNDGSFHGAAMRRLLEGHEEDQKKLLDDKIHNFFSHMKPNYWNRHDRHGEDTIAAAVDPEAGWNTKEARHLRPGSIYPTGKAPAPRRGALDLGGEEHESSGYLTWRWYPSWQALRTHHVYEIGYLACAIQLFGVTLYGVTAVVVLPRVLSSLAWWQELGAFWVLQAIAAACFLIASLMFMLETQEKWWKPEPTVLGWWIGAWATVGSVGFELIAIFGILSHTHSWGKYQSDLATIWGSTAYFITSFIQW